MTVEKIEVNESASAERMPRVPVLHWPFGRPHGNDQRLAHKESIPPELIELAKLAVVEVLQRAGTCERGLTLVDVVRRRAEFGGNRVAHEEHETLVMQLLRRLVNPLN
ncbi:MAG TPA: cation-transporting P-type ATPase, partial [Steroidobacteraceae bacterium]